jgi:hypothetical protein
MRTIDATPTWSAILPIILASLEDPNTSAESREKIIRELGRMAKVADDQVKYLKSEIDFRSELAKTFIDIIEINREYVLVKTKQSAEILSEMFLQAGPFGQITGPFIIIDGIEGKYWEVKYA